MPNKLNIFPDPKSGLQQLKELWDFSDENKFFDTLEENLDNYDFWKKVRQYLQSAHEKE